MTRRLLKITPDEARTTVGVALPNSVVTFIDREATSRCTTRAAWVRDAVVARLEREQRINPIGQTEEQTVSKLEAASRPRPITIPAHLDPAGITAAILKSKGAS